MVFQFDPRGDLSLSNIQPTSYTQHRSSLFNAEPRARHKHLSSLSLAAKLRVKPCFDWVLSSASNVHIALDKSTFKEYTAFESYVLALSDYRPLRVKGIGTVELKIKRRPDSKDSHTILLTTVLHIPSWLCNIFSDVYFNPGHEFEHVWAGSGVHFSKREEARLKPWGYTKSFCSLDRLVLAKRHKDSRSPMLEDKERELYSVNVVWPYAQRQRWEDYVLRAQPNPSFRTFSETSAATMSEVVSKAESKVGQYNSVHVTSNSVSRRATLSDFNATIVNQAPGKRVSSLKAVLSQRELAR